MYFTGTIRFGKERKPEKGAIEEGKKLISLQVGKGRMGEGGDGDGRRGGDGDGGAEKRDGSGW